MCYNSNGCENKVKDSCNSLKLIVLGSGKTTNKFIRKIVSLEKIELVGNIPDESVDNDTLAELNDEVRGLGCRFLPLDDEALRGADIIFSVEYRRIIPKEIVNSYNFINCHGGILPKWRGFSCNAWSIMNGESEIGYSIHKMNERLDDGVLYFVKKIPIDESKTYSDVHENMILSIINEVPDVLIAIHNNEIIGEKQCGSYVYCNRFSPRMGFLYDFDKTSAYFCYLFRCMAKPPCAGSGS